MNATTVRVHISVHGAWEIELPDRGDRVRCETLEEASRVAYRCAAERRPCELIVCDAYHRVVQRELIKGGESAAPWRPLPRAGLPAARPRTRNASP
jgi:hypothetical protein